jgi:hypothetical protein
MRIPRGTPRRDVDRRLPIHIAVCSACSGNLGKNPKKTSIDLPESAEEPGSGKVSLLKGRQKKTPHRVGRSGLNRQRLAMSPRFDPPRGSLPRG